MADDLGCKPEPFIRRARSGHDRRFCRVSSRPDQNVEHVVVLVDRTPQGRRPVSCRGPLPRHARWSGSSAPPGAGHCQLGWGSVGSGRAGARWAGFGGMVRLRTSVRLCRSRRRIVGHFGAIVIGGEPMAAGPEMRGDHAEHRQEPLGSAGGAEAFHGAFALPGRLVRVLRPVQVSRLPVLDRRHHRPMRHLIASQLVGDQHPRYPALLGQQVGWPEGVAPSGSHRSVREPLDSYGSCHLDHQTAGTAVVQTQWAKNRGYWVVTRCHACWNSRRPWNRRYFLRTQRIR